ncbi:MAG TPA: hypothetical protein VFE51_10000 [Verrucomicrobiae bacterium]|nr:hypothetical protein [Verrucomicrobiae bacterium]
MISFIQLPYRSREHGGPREFGPVGTALILALIVCFQLGLLVWVFMRDWQS